MNFLSITTFIFVSVVAGSPRVLESARGLEEADENETEPSATSNGGVYIESRKNMKPIFISDSDCESGESKDQSSDGTALDPNVPFMITACRGWAFETKSYFMFDMVRKPDLLLLPALLTIFLL